MSANGKDFSRLEMGSVSMENMFQGAHNDNNNMTWLIRLGGMLLVIAALKMTFDILSMLFKWFPALGSIVNMGVGLICSVVGFAWSLLVISIAGLFYRRHQCLGRLRLPVRPAVRLPVPVRLSALYHSPPIRIHLKKTSNK